MRFIRESESDVLLVRAYRRGEVKVGEESIRSSLILTPDAILRDWPPASARELTRDHIEAVIGLEPELIVLGTGNRLVFPPDEIMAVALQRGIGFEAMETAAACRTYNILVHEGRRVAAALIVEGG